MKTLLKDDGASNFVDMLVPTSPTPRKTLVAGDDDPHPGTLNDRNRGNPDGHDECSVLGSQSPTGPEHQVTAIDVLADPADVAARSDGCPHLHDAVDLRGVLGAKHGVCLVRHGGRRS